MSFRDKINARYQIRCNKDDLLSVHNNTDIVSNILSSFLPKSSELQADIQDALDGLEDDVSLSRSGWETIGSKIKTLIVTKNNYRRYAFFAHGETFESDQDDVSITDREYKEGYSKRISQFIYKLNPSIGICTPQEPSKIYILDGQHRAAQLWKLTKRFVIYVIPLPIDTPTYRKWNLAKTEDAPIVAGNYMLKMLRPCTMIRTQLLSG